MLWPVGMNLSHDSSVDPPMDHGDDTERVEAGGEALPPHDHAPVLPVAPGKRPRTWGARAVLVDRASAPLVGFPAAWGHLGAEPTCAEATTAVLGLIPLLRRDDLEPFARSALLAGAHVEGVQQRDGRGSRIAMRGRRPRGQWQAGPSSEAVDEAPVPLPARGDPRTTALARGQRRGRGPRTASDSSRAPRPAPAGGLAGPRGGHRPASAATTGVRHSWRPMGGHEGITPAAAGDQDVASRMHHWAKGSLRHTTTPLRRFWRQEIGNERPLQRTEPLESSGHRPLLENWRVLEHRKYLSGIGSGNICEIYKG